MKCYVICKDPNGKIMIQGWFNGKPVGYDWYKCWYPMKCPKSGFMMLTTKQKANIKEFRK